MFEADPTPADQIERLEAQTDDERNAALDALEVVEFGDGVPPISRQASLCFVSALARKTRWHERGLT